MRSAIEWALTQVEEAVTICRRLLGEERDVNDDTGDDTGEKTFTGNRACDARYPVVTDRTYYLDCVLAVGEHEHAMAAGRVRRVHRIAAGSRFYCEDEPSP